MVASILVGMLCAHLLCFAAIFLLISKRLPGNKMGMDCFALGNLLLGLAYVLQLAEGGPAWSLMSVINHAFTLAAPIVYGLGGMRFFGYPAPLWRPLLAFTVAYALAQLLMQWGLGSVARFALLSGMSALLLLAMTVAVIHGMRTFAKDLRGEMVFFALLIGGLSVLNAIKFMKIVDGGLEALELDTRFQVVFYIYMSSLATVLPPSIVWLVLRRLTDALHTMAAHDPLTQLLNRRGLSDALQQYFNSRHAVPAFLLLVDVDHFKRINDVHGHHVGDAVLQQVAEVLRQTVRRGDLTARIGGEEFVAICLDTDSAGALHLAERLRANIQRQSAHVADTATPLHCTATIGVSNHFVGAQGLEGAMREADVALYRGKAAGRNRVETATAPTATDAAQADTPP